MFFFISFGVLASWIVLRLTGFLLDRRVDQRIAELCLFYTNDVLSGAESRTFVSHKEIALIFIHGFTDTPQVFDEIIEKLSCQGADIFVPLLPFHGRALQEMKDFDPLVVESYVGTFIEFKRREYKTLILIGQSLGSTLLLRLSQNHQWSPERISLVLLAPAVFLYSQDWLYQLGYKTYPYFRNYWPQSTNKTRNPIEQALAYYAISAVQQLQNYCQKTEKILREMQFPHTVLIARNDNRVNVRRLQQVCQNAFCHLVIFERGSHLLYEGETVGRVVEYIKEAIDQN